MIRGVRRAAVLIAVTIYAAACGYIPGRAAPPRDMLKDLVAQQDHHVWIAWPNQEHLYQILITANGQGDSRSTALPSELADALRKQNHERQQDLRFMGDERAQRSPDGKWISYRRSDNEFGLADVSGVVRRVITTTTEFRTPLYWSPDGQYLLYCQTSLWWDTRPLREMQGQIDMMVYRVRDGVGGRVTTFGDEYPYWEYGWLVVPANIETFHVPYQ
jgi:hypothetical protein